MEIIVLAVAYLAVACTFAFLFGWSTGAQRQEIRMLDIVMATLWPAVIIGFVVWSAMEHGRRVGVSRRNLDGLRDE